MIKSGKIEESCKQFGKKKKPAKKASLMSRITKYTYVKVASSQM